jgi:hypothetical protein
MQTIQSHPLIPRGEGEITASRVVKRASKGEEEGWKVADGFEG